jgi:ATP-dependent Lon protease
MPVAAAEYTVSRTYLDWLVALPWNRRTDEVIDLKRTKDVLDADHSGLEKAKDRILEYLAVRKLNPEVKGPILCFVGPPGVGKTSLAVDRHVARPQVRARVARRHARRGRDPRPPPHLHRRAAGQIIQGLRRAESKNPVFILDEIDKLGLRLPRRSGVGPARGARSRAEQHLPRSLPRRAVRPVGGALHHHRQRARPDPARAARPHGGARAARLHGRGEARDRPRAPGRQADREPRPDGGTAHLHRRALRPSSAATRARPGVRNLEREIGRSAARLRAAAPKATRRRRRSRRDVVVSMLGAPRFLDEEMEERTKDPGVAVGLAWTPAAARCCSSRPRACRGRHAHADRAARRRHEGVGARRALVVPRARGRYGVDADFYKDAEIHLHVPSGAIPKDGPSAGVTMVTALARSCRAGRCAATSR